MKVNKLYGCEDMQTGELVGFQLCGGKVKYAYSIKKLAQRYFKSYITKDPVRYKLVELRPIPLLEEQ